MATQELIPRETTEVALQPSDPGYLLWVIAQAARDPNVDVAKMQALLDMRGQVQRENAAHEYKAAMSRLHPRLPRITKHGQILDKFGAVRSTYAKYEDVDAAIRPLLAEEGLAPSFDTKWKDGLLFVEITISHRDGHSETKMFPVPLDSNASRSKAQDMASTLSFGRRIAICAALNIITVDEDRDGQPEAEPITIEQKNQILDLLISTGANEPKFLQWLGRKSVDEIQQGDEYDRAVDALKRRGKK